MSFIVSSVILSMSFHCQQCDSIFSMSFIVSSVILSMFFHSMSTSLSAQVFWNHNFGTPLLWLAGFGFCAAAAVVVNW